MTWMKNTALTLLKTLFVLLVLSFMIVAGIFLWNLIVKDPVIEEPIIVDPTVQQTFAFSVNEFTLFEIEEFGFDFILVDINVISNKPINLSLSHFTTSENIHLNSVDSYLDRIESAGYTFGDYELIFALFSENPSMDGLIFIPIIDTQSTNLDVKINLYPNATLSFDLNNPTHVGTKSSLGIRETGLDPNAAVTMTMLNKTTVSPAEFYQMDANGNRIEASFTSQSQIIAIHIKLENKLSESFRITNAFIKNGGALYDAVDPTYLIDGATNLSNVYINATTEGYLFFEVLGDVTLSEFTEARIYLSVSEDKYYSLSLTGN